MASVGLYFAMAEKKIHYIKVTDNSHPGINVYIAKEYTEYTEYFPVSLV